jgi:hypothetical protein
MKKYRHRRYKMKANRFICKLAVCMCALFIVFGVLQLALNDLNINANVPVFAEEVTQSSTQSFALEEAEVRANNALSAIDDARTNGADKETLTSLITQAKDCVNIYVSLGGRVEDLTNYKAIYFGQVAVADIEEEQINAMIIDEIGGVDSWTNQAVDDASINTLNKKIESIDNILDQIDACSQLGQARVESQKAQLVILRETLSNRVQLENYKVEIIELLKQEEQNVLSSGIYTNVAQEQISNNLHNAIVNVEKANDSEEANEELQKGIASINSVEQLAIGWLIADIVLSIIVLIAIACVAVYIKRDIKRWYKK